MMVDELLYHIYRERLGAAKYVPPKNKRIDKASECLKS